jgi:hypothetical protein
MQTVFQHSDDEDAIMNNNVQNSPSFASAMDAFGNGLHHAHNNNARPAQPAFASALDAFGSGLPAGKHARRAGHHGCDINGMCHC